MLLPPIGILPCRGLAFPLAGPLPSPRLPPGGALGLLASPLRSAPLSLSPPGVWGCVLCGVGVLRGFGFDVAVYAAGSFVDSGVVTLVPHSLFHPREGINLAFGSSLYPRGFVFSSKRFVSFHLLFRRA